MKIKINKKGITIITVVLVSTALFLFAQPAQASWVLDLFGGLCMGIVAVLGWVLMKLMGVLIYISQYNSFINSGAVTNGWKIVRDVCNMFFVLILLIIAFATILRLENYSYKKWLPKLILMAVLINFSKTICGLLIDLAQIVMLTFVNAFKDIGGANLVDILGIKDWQNLGTTGDVSPSGWDVAAAYMLAVIYVIISIIVIAAMIAMLVMRIVMIWIYIVLSPAAYLLSAFPGGQKYASEWWSEFIKNLIVGPVLAFFIWLSFTSLASFNSASLGINSTLDQGMSCQQDAAGACMIGTSDILIKFIIAIGMLLGGMKITQEIGGVAGKAAGSVFDKGKKLAIAGAAGAAFAVGRTLKRKGGDIRDWASEKAGVDFNVVAGYKRYQEQVAANRELRKTRIRKGTLEKAEEGKTWLGRKAALMSTGDVAWQNILDKKHNIFSAGSPAKREAALDKIKEQEEIKKAAADEIKGIEQDSSNIVTDDEHTKNKNRLAVLNSNVADLTTQKMALTADPDYKNLIKKENDRTITESEEAELAKKKNAIGLVDEKLNKNTTEKGALEEKIKTSKVVASEYIKKDLIKENEEKIAGKQETVNAADKEIEKFTEVLRKNKLSEVGSARAQINAKMEGEASKHIANFSNPDQLVGIFKEAVEQQDEALMSAVYKKLAKTGNYNELNKALGYGTGYAGMMGMNEYLQKEGGMTKQDAGALIAEVGELCKSVSHYEAFGTMSMDKAGQWKETGEDQYEAAIFSEKAKLQVQQYVRGVNRLGQGSYQNGKPHTAANWEMSRNSIALYASKDGAYAEEMKKTGNVSAIQFIGANPENIKRLRENGANAVADVVEDICRKAKGKSVTNPVETIKSIPKASA